MNQKPSILVTGAAGYIASACILNLVQQGYQVIALDCKPINKFALSAAKSIIYIQADYADTHVLKTICQRYNITACMHFAAFIEVGESVQQPLKYYDNNVSKTVTLLQTLIAAGVKNYIFSSSCAVYGTPQYLPLTEKHRRAPISPYGTTKYMIELMLEDCAQAYGINYAILRYFNAAGALPEHNIGEMHEPESHLIPRALSAALEGKKFTIFGNDHATADGTCVRDYVHIADLADAHVRALQYLTKSGIVSESTHVSQNIICNLGTGTGASVEQVLQTIERITERAIERVYTDKRAGDPATLIASPTYAQKLLHWHAQYSTLDHIITTAYDWQKSRYSDGHTKVHTRACTTKSDLLS